MKKNRLLVLAISTFTAFLGPNATAQQSQHGGIPVRVVVTAEPRRGSEVPVINRDDVMVMEGRERDAVTEWIPAQNENAALELVILVDDGANVTFGGQLDEIRKFINAQPDTTKIGVAYMQNGSAQIVQNPTRDHVLAAKALRLPLGTRGINGSPYFSLSDLVKRWPPTAARRSVLIATDGIDRYYGAGDLQDPYLEAAIDDSLRAGVTVSAIYTPGEGHYEHSYWQTYWGQLYLSQLADETGGEAYGVQFTGAPVSFTPFLEDLARRLMHQYVLTFLAKPQKKAGWRRIRLMTEVPHVDLVAPQRVWVAP